MNKIILDWWDLQGCVSTLCREITNSGWKPDYVVGITRGGLLPAVMLSHYFKVPCETLKVSLRDGGEPESNLWMAEDAFGVVPSEQKDLINSRWDPMFRKNILLVDDINDSGATFNWIIKDWKSGCFPNQDAVWNSVWNKNVRFAVLYDNVASQCDARMDYSAREINKSEQDVWVDFPYENWWDV